MRVGLIGAGRIGVFHGQTLADHPEVSGVTGTGPLCQRATAVAADIDAKVAPDVDATLTKIDAVVMAATSDVHASRMHLAADAGIQVFCEKSIAGDRAATDARKGVRVANACNNPREEHRSVRLEEVQ